LNRETAARKEEKNEKKRENRRSPKLSSFHSPFSREEDEFIVTHVNRMGNKWTRISQLFGEQFGARSSCCETSANWLIRDAENAFLQHRLTLPPIEEILSVEAGFGRRGGSEPTFGPQQFFAGR
jgi:hypothetical protein